MSKQEAPKVQHEDVVQNRRRAIGLYQVAQAVVLLVLLVLLWPDPPKGGGAWGKLTLQIGSGSIDFNTEARLLLIVMVTGALGSYVHAATSFATYVGNRRLVTSWAWWYALRPFLGAALALIFYFVVRGGLLSSGTAATEMSVYGISALSGLVGMFSKQATDKLREVFDTLFKTETGGGDDARADKLGANTPVTREMIERRKIAAFVMAQDQGPEAVRITELHRMLLGVVTRIPVFTPDDGVLCVIHQSLLYKFIADRSMDAAQGKTTFAADSATLAEFLAAPGMEEMVKKSMAFVPVGAMLSDAKALMDRTPHCQDIFVTEHGQPGEPVLGWLTDAEVRRAAKV